MYKTSKKENTLERSSIVIDPYSMVWQHGRSSPCSTSILPAAATRTSTGEHGGKGRRTLHAPSPLVFINLPTGSMAGQSMLPACTCSCMGRVGSTRPEQWLTAWQQGGISVQPPRLGSGGPCVPSLWRAAWSRSSYPLCGSPVPVGAAIKYSRFFFHCAEYLKAFSSLIYVYRFL